MTDIDVIKELSDVCDFSHEMDGDQCVAISFYDDTSVFGGTLRRHPAKGRIVSLVARLAHLKHLNLRKCKLGVLPKMASCCLEYVDLGSNDLQEFPEWLLSQPLKYLSVGANNLTEVPSLSGLPLETLKLHKNPIRQMPAIGQQIKSLNLFLTRMPFPTLDLPLLEVLTYGLSDTKKVETLPFPNLRWLTLTVNQIEALPDDLCLLNNLEGLQLAKNRLKRLPNDIGRLQKLKVLTLYSNDIVELPESFFELTFKKLNVAHNPLVDRDRVLKMYSEIDFVRA